jgi:thioester reductase-like protein
MAEGLSTLQLALLAQKAADQRRLLAAEPIAVVGLGCRFPGGSGQPDLDTPDSFWEFLLQGREAVTEVPASRWPLERFYSATPGTPGKMHCRHGAFLQAPEQFDPGRFGIAPREAQAMDPQHRLLLEVAQEALERAGYSGNQLRGLAAGVYVGICTGDYAWRQLRDQLPDSRYDMYFATGTSFAMASGRLAYALGLQGPALAVDTACSSSLVAVDLACRSLRDRSTDLALAGGVSLLLTPVNSLCFARSGMMAPDGHCKTFDAAADGYVRGEGCGVVVLKRLADALAAGDPVLAVLRGSGVNQDGASAGLTVPNGEAQAQLLQRTLEQAQLDGDAIDVLEAHGTGTPLGDPIELKALAPIYGRPERPQPLRLGSVKTNLGHLEGAAGIAGLIKAVLMVQHGQIPPHLHLRQPTPYLNWHDWQLRLPTEAEPWPERPGPRRAAVSSFGFSGTNAHVLVEQSPESSPVPPQPAAALRDGDLLLLSAGSEAGLRQLADRMAAWLPLQPPQAWPAICATSRQARSSQRWRLAVRATTAAEALDQLRGPLTCAEAAAQAPRLAFALAAASQAEHWIAWQRFGVEATALVQGPAQRPLAEELAGTPPQLRLITAGEGAAAKLQQHGYGTPLPLAAPQPEALVQLWLAGHGIDWTPLAPEGLWTRPVLPTTPFDRIRCWIEESEAPELPEGLEHQRQWRPLPPSSAKQAAPELLWLLGGDQALNNQLAQTLPQPPLPLADLAALDQTLASLDSSQRPTLLLAPPPAAAVLDEAFWRHWLPLLQGLISRAPQLGPLHWLLRGADTAAGEAWAALARGWAREVGSQAGGLLWCGPAGEGLDQLLMQQPPPRAGEEWRLGAAGLVETASLKPLPQNADPAAPPVLPPTATTLISGGFGALGLATAEALQRWGARHLTLVARRPPTPEQQQHLAALERAGVAVAVEQLDIAEGAAVEALFARLAAAGRPLAGIIHAAGVLDDGLLINQSPSRCAAVAAAKVQGALHLDRCSRALPHGYFVVYSSLAATLGSPGQVAYGAANGFLDGLMLQRQAAGLPGLAINWGPWAGAGMAARHQGGLEPLQPAEALALLERWLPRQGRVALARLQPASADHPLAPRLEELAERLPALEPPAAHAAVETCLAELLAELGGFNPSELTAATRLDALGMDSLMAVELATAVQAGLGVSLGLGALAGEPTLGSLAGHLLALLENPSATDAVAVDLGAEAQLPPDLVEQLQTNAEAAGLAGPGGAILLTGATGFLGAFLLADQLQRHPQLSIYCLVRADGAGTARARLRANLEHYGLWQDDWAARIMALPGDLSLPGLGLDADTWRGLTTRVGGVLHNGAQLSYVAPYGQMRAANVGGTLEVLRLAVSAGLPLEFISSTSVYEAAAYRGQQLDEASDLAAWQGIHLGYSQTKWVSERLVWQAAQAGLPVRIHRPPLIAGHSRTGAWHEQDFLHRLVRGCLALGQAPELAMELDLVPVDYVVAAIGALAWTPLTTLGSPDVLHLHHPRPVLWGDVLAGLISRGAPLRAIPLQPWLEALAQQPSNPLYPLQPFFTHRWEPERLTYPELNQPGHKARPSCARSLERLQALGVHCPDYEQLVDPYARTFLAELLVHD